MSNLIEDSRQNFLKIQPGTQLDWNTFTLKQGESAVVNLISQTVEKFNKDSGFYKDDGVRPVLRFSPMSNPILHIFQKMEVVWQYFCGEYEIRCKSRYFRELFQKVWPEFIRGWYFGQVYVAYGHDFEEIDRQAFNKKNPQLDFELDCVTGLIRLYTRESKGTFHSIYAGQSGIKFTDEMKSRVVRCSAGCLNNWLYWWNLFEDLFDGLERFKCSIRGLSKQALLTPKSRDELENIQKQLDNYSCFLVRDSSQPTGETDTNKETSLGKSKLTEIEVMNNDTPMKILDAVQKYFEIHAAHLGFQGSAIEQKKERLTAGENFPRHKVVSNIRTYLINSLNTCFDEMRKAWRNHVDGQEIPIVPEDLQIVPSNQAFAQGLPEQQFGGTFNKFGRFNNFNNQPYQSPINNDQ